MDIWDIFAEEEAKRLAETRAEIAAEDAAWRALPQAERDRILAEREDKWDALFSAADPEDEDDDDDDDDGDDDDGEGED